MSTYDVPFSHATCVTDRRQTQRAISATVRLAKNLASLTFFVGFFKNIFAVLVLFAFIVFFCLHLLICSIFALVIVCRCLSIHYTKPFAVIGRYGPIPKH